MKSCILISSHLNNDEKIKSSINLLNNIKRLSDLPILFIGNYEIPTEVQNMVNFSFFMSENPVINRHTTFWSDIPDFVGLGKNLRRVIKHNDFGYAHLYQVYHGFKIAESLGFNHVIHFNYDITFEDSSFINFLKLCKINKNVVYNYNNNGKDEAIHTNVYSFIIKDFIKSCEDNLDFYKNLNPPNISKGWYCEVFVRWMIERSNFGFHMVEKRDFNQSMSSVTHYFNGSKLLIYPFYEKNILLIFCKSIPEDTCFTFEDGKSYKLNRLSDFYFSLPLLKGKFFHENKLLFNYNDIKNNYVVDMSR